MYHSEVRAQTPTAHLALPPTPPSSFFFYHHPPPPHPQAAIISSLCLRCAVCCILIDIPCFFKTIHNQIIQYTYFVFVCFCILFLYMRKCLSLCFDNQCKIFALHCNYDCLFVTCFVVVRLLLCFAAIRVIW